MRQRSNISVHPEEWIYVLQAAPKPFACLITMRTDGSSRRTLVSGLGGTPDGLTIDPLRGHLYWTNMGERWNENDGFIERVDLDGRNRIVIVPKGATFTPKQIEYEPMTDRLYWCDREGMRVMSSKRDGSDIKVLVQTGYGLSDRSDERRHCVGIAIDPNERKLYWTQKGPSKGNVGRILRATLDVDPTVDLAARNDIEVLMDGLPEPIDLLLDPEAGALYWTDRGRRPRGNSLNVATLSDAGLANPRILISGLWEGIGVCSNPDRTSLFVTDLILGHIRKLELGFDMGSRIIRRGLPLTGIVCGPAA